MAYPSEASILLGIQSAEQIGLQQTLARLSPSTLFGEAVVGMLHPTTRTFGVVFANQVEGAIAGAPLSFGQSLLLIWPQLTGLVAGVIVLFAIAYVLFQRQEVRA